MSAARRSEPTLALALATGLLGVPALAGAAAPTTADPLPSAAQRRGQTHVVAPRVSPSSFESVAPPSSAAGLGLQRLDDGRYVYADPARRFSARIDIDGTVQFADRWRRLDSRPGRRRTERGRAGGTPPEGLLDAVDPFAGAPVSGPTEWALRARGHDPSASAKATWLRRTEDFRARLALAWHRDQLRERVTGLPDRLAALWSDPERTAAERRATIFAQWDECADPLAVAVTTETSLPTLARDRRRAAEVARGVIERFVRETLPAGSADAFTAAELQRLNADRDSTARFDPYRSTPGG